MTFTEKLERLTANANKTRLSKEAGLPATAISNYLSKKQIPRGDTALSLARVLKVPLEWLLDDEQGWPPTSRESLETVSTEAVRQEFGRRIESVVMMMRETLRRARLVDWVEFTEKLCKLDPAKDIPEDLREAAELPRTIGSLYWTLETSLPRFAGNTLCPANISLFDLFMNWKNMQDHFAYREASQIAHLWINLRENRSPEAEAKVREGQASIADMLKYIKRKGVSSAHL